jgi:hypothetical protein
MAWAKLGQFRSGDFFRHIRFLSLSGGSLEMGAAPSIVLERRSG